METYKSKFLLTGTPEQIEIVKGALDKIYFPWERLTFPHEPVEIGWANLNGQSLEGTLQHKSGTKGIINGREYTLGVFYTHSGRIYIDNLLVKYPDYAAQTVSAEIAHAVDYFLPLTDKMREEIIALTHLGDPTEHEHSWWEKVDYGSEYFTLIGEAFMQAFTVAYSDMLFEAGDFTHTITKEQAPQLRNILGIERTEVVPTLPPPIQNPIAEEEEEVPYLPPPPIQTPIIEEDPEVVTPIAKKKGMDKKLVSEEKHEADYIAKKYKIPVKVVRSVLKETQSRRKVYEKLRALGYNIIVK